MQLRGFFYSAMLLVSIWGYGQSGFLQYTNKNGLTQNAVTAIFKDSRGFLWIGTQDGLNRFDGIAFTQYKHSSSDISTLSDQYITAISEDGSGKIWVGTRNGLNKWDIQKNKFERIHLNPSRKKEIQYVFEELYSIGNGNLALVVEEEMYIWYHERKYFKKLTKRNHHRSIYAASKNGIWKFSMGSFFRFNAVNGIFEKKESGSVRYSNKQLQARIFIDKQHLIWFLDETNESKPILRFFDTKQVAWLKDSIQLPEKVYQINFDQMNNAWIASLSGIIKISEQLKPFFWKSTSFPESINQSNAVLCSFHDSSGLSWIGFANNGIVLYNPSSKTFQLDQPQKKRETVFSYTEDSFGNHWLAAVSGLYKKSKNAISYQLIIPKKVRAIAAGLNGQIWIAIENEGLYEINPAQPLRLVASIQNNLLSDNTIFHLNYNAKRQQLFIATKSGLFLLNSINRKIVRYAADISTSIYQLAGSYILHSFTDRKERTWISSNLGIDVLDKNLNRIFQFKSDNDQSPYIKRTIITGSTEDANGNIWVATLSNGIYKWDKGKFFHFDQMKGLSSNVVSGIAADDYNRIWIATTSGMNLLDQTNNRIHTITEQNGIPASDFLLSSFTKNSQGHLLVGSSEGMVIVQPELFKPMMNQLNCLVAEAQVNYAPVELKSHYELDADDKSISLEIAAPCFINADKVVYQYRLVGFVDQWVTLKSNNRRINFTNLPYKKLALEFRAAENIAEINTAPISSIFISRKPPFWQNIYILIPAVILFLGLIFLLIRFFTKRKLNQQLQKAAIEQSIYKERERISRDLHDHLGAYAAAIKSNIIQLEKNDHHAPETMFQLKGNAEDMVNALRETIWVMQYEQVAMTSISDRFKNLINRIAPNYTNIDIDVKEEIIAERNLSPGESIHLLRIMQEGLTNALKHSNCSKISISICINHPIQVTIEDDGIGFDHAIGSSGFGLQNIQDRAAEIGIKVHITSKIGFGTRISLSF